MSSSDNTLERCELISPDAVEDVPVGEDPDVEVGEDDVVEGALLLVPEERVGHPQLPGVPQGEVL